MKNWFGLFIISSFLFAACSIEPGEVSFEVGDWEEVDVDSDVASEQGGTETFTSDDKETTFTQADLHTAVKNIANWSSFHEVYRNAKVSEQEDVLDTQYNVEKTFIRQPYQLYVYSHGIEFGQYHAEEYTTDAFTITNYDDGGWEKADTSFTIDPTSAMVEFWTKVLNPQQNYFYNEVFMYEEGDDVHATGYINDETKEEIYQHLQSALIYNYTVAELEAMDITDFAFSLNESSFALREIFMELVMDKTTKQLTSYYIAMDFKENPEDDNDPVTLWEITAQFDQVNAIQSIDIPEEALNEAGI